MSTYKRLSKSSAGPYKNLLDAHDTWMFDCDGVLWHGDKPIDGAIKLLETLRALSQCTHQSIFRFHLRLISTSQREKYNFCHE